jgi:hydrogenase-4 component C
LVALLFSASPGIAAACITGGPSVLQNYRDIAKLMKRRSYPARPVAVPGDALHPDGLLLLVAMIIPIFTPNRLWFGWRPDPGGLPVRASRFSFTFGFETGSTFGGIGGSELLVSSDRADLLVLFVMALLAGSTNLGTISSKIASGSALLHFGLAWDAGVCIRRIH